MCKIGDTVYIFLAHIIFAGFCGVLGRKDMFICRSFIDKYGIPERDTTIHMRKIKFTLNLSLTLSNNRTQRKQEFPYSMLINLIVRFLPLIIISTYSLRVSAAGTGLGMKG